jgi:hypothetical protein
LIEEINPIGTTSIIKSRKPEFTGCPPSRA